jgi:hypothetical protein
MNNRDNDINLPIITRDQMCIGNYFNTRCLIELPDNVYYYGIPWTKVTVQNKRLHKVEGYLLGDIELPSLVWHFEYEPTKLYRELPKISSDKHLWTGPSEESEKSINRMMVDFLNTSPQFNGTVTSIKHCAQCDKHIVYSGNETLPCSCQNEVVDS